MNPDETLVQPGLDLENDTDSKTVTLDAVVIQPEYVSVTDIDLVTYLVDMGFEYNVKREGSRVIFVFDSKEVSPHIDRYPSSHAHKILSVYHALYQTTKYSRR
jgi:hypothetical protein